MDRAVAVDSGLQAHYALLRLCTLELVDRHVAFRDTLRACIRRRRCVPLSPMDELALPRPMIRCLTKTEAAEYLGIGITLFDELRIPAVRFGRRCVYDRVDLDAWLDDYKQRGRAGKEVEWPVKPGSTGDQTLVAGGWQQRYRTASAYAKALGLKTERKPKPSSPS